MSNRPFLAVVAVVGVLAAVAVTTMRPAPVPTVAASEMGAFGFAPGELVPNFDYRSLDDGKGTLESLLDGKRGLVIALRTVECPVSQKYGHKLAELEEAYAEQGIAFAYLDVSSQDSEEDYREDLEVYGRNGQGCSRCGDTIEERRFSSDGRFVYHCPGCQTRLDHRLLDDTPVMDPHPAAAKFLADLDADD